MSSRHTHARPRDSFRIVAGRWRGRRLPFEPGAGVRPTPDRVRETLFNWLAPVIDGARCLDLFCGSGALGLEGLSRGAAAATFIDSQASVIARVRENLILLDASGGRTRCADAMTWLQGEPECCYDIVFLDPPFGSGLITPAAMLLEKRGWLADNARIHIECGSDETPEVPAAWHIVRERRAGNVAYRLAERRPGDDACP